MRTVKQLQSAISNPTACIGAWLYLVTATAPTYIIYISACLRHHYLAMSMYPQLAVACKGVQPSLSATFISAPFFTRNSTIEMLSSIHDWKQQIVERWKFQHQGINDMDNQSIELRVHVHRLGNNWRWHQKALLITPTYMAFIPKRSLFQFHCTLLHTQH